MRRRDLLLSAPLWTLSPGHAAVMERRALVFPRDHGAHLDERTEWWYITGRVQAQARTFGFQLTFFRSRVDETQGLRSSLAARQLIFAHAAVTDVAGRQLLSADRIARAGAQADVSVNDTDLRLRDWTLLREGTRYTARMRASEFELALDLTQTQPMLLQGERGWSRKGPRPEQASFYYSLPQLAVGGSVTLRGQSLSVTGGSAWLDHEWSEAFLDPDAVGWDWIGMNLADGSALTAFRLRRKDGSTLYSGGSFRARGGTIYPASNGETEFSAQRRWRSPASGATYPVEWLVKTPADIYTVKAVLDNQEMQAQASSGSIYWEGLSDLYDSNGHKVGSGYLEMTGYARPLIL